MRLTGIALSACFVFISLPLSAEQYPIAGVTPDQRPAGAPVILEFVKPKGWEQQFTYGVTAPYPASLSWRADQGAWFTPFNHPGMTGRYDLRGWHSKKSDRR